MCMPERVLQQRMSKLACRWPRVASVRSSSSNACSCAAFEKWLAQTNDGIGVVRGSAMTALVVSAGASAGARLSIGRSRRAATNKPLRRMLVSSGLGAVASLQRLM